MWMHLDSPDYSFSGVGIAAAEKPTGPFRLMKVTHPNRRESRDMTLYRDEDDTAYPIHAKDWNEMATGSFWMPSVRSWEEKKTSGTPPTWKSTITCPPATH